MIKPFGIVCCGGVMLLLGGCVNTPPAGPGEVASAYAVGDRARVGFDEIIVSLRLRGSNSPYQNLHVSLTAFINPIRKTSGSEWDVESILRRSEGRMAAKVSEALSNQPEQSIDDSKRLRGVILSEAQPIVDEAMKRWEHGEDYRVELAVSSLYWTDASVGRPAQGRGWWGAD